MTTMLNNTRIESIFSKKYLILIKKIADWSILAIVALCVAGVFTLIGILKKEQWAYNAWLLPVIAALVWEIFQER